MKTKLTVIAGCIATLFISGSVFAKDTWEYHESGWDNVKSYGKVVIAQDSVSQWGPWEDFVEPAAGAPSPVVMPGMSGNDPYRTNPVTVATGTDVCRTGDWCGYAVFSNWSSTQSGNNTVTAYAEGSSDYTYSGPQAGRFGLTHMPDNPTVVTLDGGAGPGQTSWRVASMTGVAPLLPNSGDNLATTYGYYSSQGGLHDFYAYREASIDNGSNTSYDYADINGFPHNSYSWYLPTTNKEVAVGWFYREVGNYVRGSEESGYTDSWKEMWGYYVAGIATPQAYLDSQRAGNVVATYSGNSFDWSGYRVPVDMTVNFGNATWSGSWNNGSNGKVYTNTDSSGNTYWQGQVGFNASGTISGANINSTSLSANDGTVTGKVQGTFYGQTAGSIGGVSNIVKTVTYGGNSETVSRVAVQPTTVSATHTAIFLVDKTAVDLAKVKR